MTTYLKNLAEMLVNPDGGVQPRLLGRFEPPYLAGVGLFDVEPADEIESAPSREAHREEPTTTVKPPRPSGEQPATAEPAPPPGDRQRHEPESAPITSPPEIVSEPPTSKSVATAADRSPAARGQTSRPSVVQGGAADNTADPGGADAGNGKTVCPSCHSRHASQI